MLGIRYQQTLTKQTQLKKTFFVSGESLLNQKSKLEQKNLEKNSLACSVSP